MMSLSRESVFTYLFAGFVLILPFLFVPGQNPYEYPKFLFVVITSQLVILLFIVRFFKTSHRLIHADRLTILALGYVGIVFLANILGLDPKVSFLGSLYRHQGFLLLISCVILFFVIRTLSSTKHLNKKFLFKSLIGSGLLLSCIAIVQALMLYFQPSANIPVFQGRFIATMGNPNFLGGYLAILLPLILYTNSLKKHTIIQKATITLFLITILLTDSRSAMIAALLVIGIYNVGILHSYAGGKRLLTVVIICSIVTLAFLSSFSQQTKRASYWDNRMLIWSEGVQAVAKRPLLGYGQENFELVFPKERKMKVDNAHNIFLEIAVSSGFIGLCLFLMIFYVKLRETAFPIRLALISFLIVAQFNPLSITHIVLFWILLGIRQHTSELAEKSM